MKMVRKFDMKDVTFCIPVFIDSRDRKQNLDLVIRYITNYFDTNIIVGETNNDVPKLKSTYGKRSDVGYVYYHNEENFFHKNKILNMMYMRVRTPYIFAYDCDALYEPKQYVDAVKMLRRDKADCCFAYNTHLILVPRTYIRNISKTYSLRNVVKDEKELEIFQEQFQPGLGCLMKKKTIYECGMENENFKAWGPEDRERIYRFKRLGARFARCGGKAYHINHFRGKNTSVKSNVYLKGNDNEFAKIKAMDDKDLIYEIKSWKWVKNKRMISTNFSMGVMMRQVCYLLVMV